jgi:lysophospholipase L1-like esterase
MRTLLSRRGVPIWMVLLSISVAVVAGAVPRSTSDVAAGASSRFSASFGATPDQHWLGTWMAGTMPAQGNPTAVAGFSDQTVREVVHTTLGGPEIRMELANTFGTAPLKVADVEVARSAGHGTIVPGSSVRVTFDGAAEPIVPPGARLVSDPVAFHAPGDSDIAVSLYFVGQTGPATQHRQSRELAYVSTSGNHTQDATASEYPTQLESWFYVDAVQVRADSEASAVVALGDSITDGDKSTIGADRRWPNDLARRILASPRLRDESVLNAGIGANRLLNDSILGGPNALARVDRDVLAQPHGSTLIVLEGTNDIGFSQAPPIAGLEPRTEVSAAGIIAGYKQLIARAHTAGLRILGGTLNPFRGSFYWSPAAEAKREAVNEWIRGSGAFDGVVDFARAVGDPADPSVYAPAFDSGDHLHPNDAGYQAMADAIDLDCLAPTGLAIGPTRSCTRS